MKTEYAVMVEYDGEDAQVYSDGYASFEDADRALGKAQSAQSYLFDEGLTVRSAYEAAKAVERFKSVADARFFVAKRAVAPWEETWS